MTYLSFFFRINKIGRQKIGRGERKKEKDEKVNGKHFRKTIIS